MEEKIPVFGEVRRRREASKEEGKCQAALDFKGTLLVMSVNAAQCV